MSYIIHTQKRWTETLDDLAETFDKWGVGPRAYRVIAIRARRQNYYLVDERRVTVEFLHPKSGQQIIVTKGDLDTPDDNLRAIYIALERLRMIEKAGLADIVREALIQIDAPKDGASASPRSKRPWYEVLEVAPNASPDVIEAVYRAKAKSLHPDTVDGDQIAMQELNQAREEGRKMHRENVR